MIRSPSGSPWPWAVRSWSCGPTRLPDDVPVGRAVFLEPLADCLHAVTDQARVRDGERVVVVAAGSMGLQMIAVSTRAGAHVVAVEPQAERRELARAFGAAEDLDPEGWVDAVRDGLAHSVSHRSNTGCCRALRPGLSANIQPLKMRFNLPSRMTSSISTKVDVLGVSVGARE